MTDSTPFPSRRVFMGAAAAAATLAAAKKASGNATQRPVQMPTWSRKFTEPARYKCVYGGRGSGKSWNFAELLISEAAQKPIRVVCGHEVQSNIWQSVNKQSLEAAIHRLGLADQFQVHKDRITSSKGAAFFFHCAELVPDGLEDVDRVWLEDAQLIKKETHSKISHATKKAGAEIWYSWNPLSRADWVWQRFVVNPRASDIIEKVNFDKNPWFPAALEEKRLADLRLNPDFYAHIWEGDVLSPDPPATRF